MGSLALSMKEAHLWGRSTENPLENEDGCAARRPWIIERTGRNEDAWLADLNAMDTPEARAKAMAGSVEDWATESLLAARGAYQDPATGQRVRPGARLADAYQDAN